MRRSFSQTYSRPQYNLDPFMAHLAPPLNETPEERDLREQNELKAKEISERIDEDLQRERIEKKKARPEVNVLLLGQSESGKSTTLKQFQLLYSPADFHSERIAWRAVIYLNLVRSVRRILEALSPESDTLDEFEEYDATDGVTDIIITSNGRPPSAILGSEVAKYEEYRHRLAPLIELEDRLSRLLSSSDDDEPTQLAPSHPSWDHYHQYQQYPDENVSPHIFGGFVNRPTPTITIPRQPMVRSTSAGTNDNKPKEITVRSTKWKKAFGLNTSRTKSPKTPKSGEIEGWWEDPDDPVHTLNACANAMWELWRDPEVRQTLAEKYLRLEEISGFYLDEIPRITAKKYIPTDDDVLKARLKTTGVVEHTFMINVGNSKGVQWRIYDVGGARNQRQAWAPYFEDVNAIIFLAPISAFDQVLAEDHRINRLEDSLLLWKSLISNPLLAKVNIVLFLNKIDLLQAKLDSGVRLSHHMFSYGNRPNDFGSVSKYFWNKFGALHQAYTRNKERGLYIHFTAVTDTKRTATIISSVRDIIIKSNLRTMRLV